WLGVDEYGDLADVANQFALFAALMRAKHIHDGTFCLAQGGVELLQHARVVVGMNGVNQRLLLFKAELQVLCSRCLDHCAQATPGMVAGWRVVWPRRDGAIFARRDAIDQHFAALLLKARAAPGTLYEAVGGRKFGVKHPRRDVQANLHNLRADYDG